MSTNSLVSIDDTVLQRLQSEIQTHGLKYLVPSYVDMHGIPKAKMVPIAYLERMLGGSELFTGAALDGVPQNMADDEVGAVPDPASFMVVPWRDDTGWFASDLWYQGKPFEPCNRGILKRVLKQAADKGFTVNCGVEAEFFVFKDDNAQNPNAISNLPVLEKPAYDSIRLMDNLDSWLGETVDAMNALGWSVYSFDHEDGVGQFELDFQYADALTMSDRFVFLRVMVNEFARQHGGYASFMPKPFADKAGSGAHFNMSLADASSGDNLFNANGDDQHNMGLSALGYQFTAGVMQHLPAILALSAPTINSYKRLIMKGSTSGYTWAPCFTSWGGNNRSNTVRVPSDGGRVELRAADSACNPYLGMALMIAAGLEGIEKQLELAPANTVNLFEQTEEYRRNNGIEWLPRTLDEAITALEIDPLSRQVLGDKMLESWVETKREECLSYANHVSQWERDRYLRMF
ncbi:type III glutamate--ammonia ligase [Chromatiales bacterium (ex Bugula neritina AB1)]|nr:type III glutamate--ammonia ligase [Chromatiales bacterium (ex Bugula neritina AB1)]